jgi:hypothetical protein
VNPKTGHHFELDVWLPNIDLGFEFQVSTTKFDFDKCNLTSNANVFTRGYLLVSFLIVG